MKSPYELKHVTKNALRVFTRDEADVGTNTVCGLPMEPRAGNFLDVDAATLRDGGDVAMPTCNTCRHVLSLAVKHSGPNRMLASFEAEG